MARTLHDDMRAAWEANALDTVSGFAEAITHWPLGVEGDQVAVTAIVHLAAEGQNSLDDEHGSRAMRAGELILSTSVVVSAERGNRRDLFVVRGELWAAVRIVARRAYSQRVAIERAEGVTTKRTRI